MIAFKISSIEIIDKDILFRLKMILRNKENIFTIKSNFFKAIDLLFRIKLIFVFFLRKLNLDEDDEDND